jgi:LysR family carnitine catabolism transcriptional activator
MALVLGDPESSVRMLFECACAAKGLTVAPAYEATYVSTLIAMVCAGLGVGVLTASTVDPNVERKLRICPIEDPPITRSVMLIRRAGRSNSPAADAFER